jgi:hypothetical protein
MMRRDMEFREGFAEFTIKEGLLEDFKELLTSRWDEGFIGWSEKDEDYSPSMNLLSLLNEKSPSGYVMEIDLWRSNNGIYEEFVLERLVQGFRFHIIKLVTDGYSNGNCYWRKTKLFKREGKAIQPAIEVIIHEYRIILYLTIPSREV